MNVVLICAFERPKNRREEEKILYLKRNKDYRVEIAC